jgi:hypothetical protein
VPEGDQDQRGVPMAVAAVPGGFDQLLDLRRGQVLARPQVSIGRPNRYSGRLVEMKAAPISVRISGPSSGPEIRNHSTQRTTAHLLYERLKSFQGVIGKCAVIRCALWLVPISGCNRTSKALSERDQQAPFAQQGGLSPGLRWISYPSQLEPISKLRMGVDPL